MLFIFEESNTFSVPNGTYLSLECTFLQYTREVPGNLRLTGNGR
jgi:hypothetical protein